MTRSRIAVLLLLLLTGAAHVTPPRAAPSVESGDRVTTVEEFWPDGSLRLRKQVLVPDDGATVDHGAFLRWYADGTKEYEAVFVRGRKEGTTVRYHRNGRPASRETYRDGKRDGPCISWNPAGEKVKEENWADGRPHGTWTIWKDGVVEWTHTFDHGDPTP